MQMKTENTVTATMKLNISSNWNWISEQFLSEN